MTMYDFWLKDKQLPTNPRDMMEAHASKGKLIRQFDQHRYGMDIAHVYKLRSEQYGYTGQYPLGNNTDI